MFTISLFQHNRSNALELSTDRAHALYTAAPLVVVEHVEEIHNQLHQLEIRPRSRILWVLQDVREERDERCNWEVNNEPDTRQIALWYILE
jgi:hypothetical protein